MNLIEILSREGSADRFDAMATKLAKQLGKDHYFVKEAIACRELAWRIDLRWVITYGRWGCYPIKSKKLAKRLNMEGL